VIVGAIVSRVGPRTRLALVDHARITWPRAAQLGFDGTRRTSAESRRQHEEQRLAGGEFSAARSTSTAALIPLPRDRRTPGECRPARGATVSCGGASARRVSVRSP
jgi:hypothetical protein